MIVPIIGNVGFQITMDPTVWIFDDRKIILEDAFSLSDANDNEDELQKAAERWERAVSETVKPQVNRSLTRHERENILKYSYVMPIHDFLKNAEVMDGAKNAVLVTDTGEETISILQLFDSYLLFAIDGKPILENGPVQLLYKDGSNKDNPIKGIKKIVID